jgi:competence protein ComGC
VSAAPWSQPGSRNRATGFTLLEMVIAFTILALLITALFMSFRLAVNAYRKGEERMEEDAQKRALEDLIKRQVGSIYPLRPALSMANLERQQMDPAQAMIFAQTPLFFGAPDSMTFITVAPLALIEHPGLTVVRYGLAFDPRRNIHYLGEMETRYVGLDSFNSMIGIPEGVPLSLIEPVEQVRFEYYGYDAQSQTYSWFESWNAEEMRASPSAVRIYADQKTITVAISAVFNNTPFGALGGMQ